MLLVEVRFSGQRRFAEWKLDLLLRSWGWLLPGFGSGLALVRLKRARLYRHTRHSCVVSCKEKPLPQSLVPSSLSTPSSYSPLLSFQKSKKKKKERKKETSSLCDREKDLFRFIFSTWRDLKKKNNKRTCNPGPRVGIGEEEGEESPLCLLREGVPKPFGARRWGDGNRRGPSWLRLFSSETRARCVDDGQNVNCPIVQYIVLKRNDDDTRKIEFIKWCDIIVNLHLTGLKIGAKREAVNGRESASRLPKSLDVDSPCLHTQTPLALQGFFPLFFCSPLKAWLSFYFLSFWSIRRPIATVCREKKTRTKKNKVGTTFSSFWILYMYSIYMYIFFSLYFSPLPPGAI